MNMEKKPFYKYVHDFVFRISRYIEVLLAIIIMIVIVCLIGETIVQLFQTSILDMNFTNFLSNTLGLVIGIEFVKLLCKHTPETLIEVLMFAVARQMVVEHMPIWELLVGAGVIAALFAIRKFLFLKEQNSAQLSDKF